MLQEQIMQEIERKFLVKNDAYKAQASSHKRITQGYLTPIQSVLFGSGLREIRAF